MQMDVHGYFHHKRNLKNTISNILN